MTKIIIISLPVTLTDGSMKGCQAKSHLCVCNFSLLSLPLSFSLGADDRRSHSLRLRGRSSGKEKREKSSSPDLSERIGQGERSERSTFQVPIDSSTAAEMTASITRSEEEKARCVIHPLYTAIFSRSHRQCTYYDKNGLSIC